MLTTNDLRVCELLARGGRWTASDLSRRLWPTGGGTITVRAYLAGLAAVREAENLIEPQRRAAGARCSRAYELAVRDTDRREGGAAA